MAQVTAIERSSGKKETWLLLEKRSPEYKAWIMAQVTVFAEMWREPVTAELLQLYAEHLSDLTPYRVKRTIDMQMAHRKRIEGFPTIGDLRAIAGDIIDPYEPDDRPKFALPEAPLTDEEKREFNKRLSEIAAKARITVAESPALNTKSRMQSGMTEGEFQERKRILSEQAEELKARGL